MYYLIIVLVILIVATVLIIPSGNSDIIYINRKTGEKIKEKVPGEIYLKWLYNNPFAKIALHGAIKIKFVSEMYGKKMDSLESKNKVEEFIKEYNINMDESQKKSEEFNSFNEFFYRNYKNRIL